MIDISSETVVSLTEATRHLPRRRKGNRPATVTLFRWAQKGLKGIRLETTQVGGTKCTSLEALQRFFGHLTDSEAPTAVATASKVQARAVAAAERQLDDNGI